MARLDHAYRLNSWMVSQLEEPLTKIYEVAFSFAAPKAIAADDSPIDNNYDDWSIKFPLLYKMTPVEEMEYQSMAADRDEKYMRMGVFQTEEVRQQFYGTGALQYQPKIEMKLSAKLGRKRNVVVVRQPRDK